MKPKSTPRAFLVMSGSALFAVTCASADSYYWDSDNDAAGFGSASSADDIWSSSTASTATAGFSSDSTGSTAIDGNPAVKTTTSDTVYFGVDSTSPLGGTVTIEGPVDAGTVITTNNGFAAGADPTINFAAAGTYERINNNGSFPAGTIFTGLGTSLTWKPQRNLNVANVSHSAAKVILQTSPATPYPYPGRTVMNSAANFGAANAPLVFDHGTIRMATGFPYSSLSAMDAAHPVSFTADKDFGLEMVNGDFTEFTIDQVVDLGTGLFWVEGNRPIILTQANLWGGVSIIGGRLSVSDALQLGPDNSSTLVRFGSGTTDLSGGTLTITGTTLTDLGARTFATTPDKTVTFDIVDAAHTFTLDAALEQAGSTLGKDGDGTLALSGAANTYTGATSVNAGTLALINGSHASAITVSSGASLGFEIGSETTSSASVDLTGGTVTISNPGAVDGSTSYLLMTAAGGFTFTDIATQLGTAVPDYALELQNSDTELWLVYAASADYSTWATDNGIEGEPFDGDFNSDGITNGIAYALGLSPTASSQPAGVLSGDTITFTKGADAIANSDVTWIIETSETLSGSWLEEVTQAAGDATETISYTFTPGPGVPKQFARLKAVQE